MTNQPSAYNHALWLLGAREHSAQELQQKLSRKGFSAEDIQAAIDRLSEYNYVNDQRFAEAFARSKAAKPLGKQRILSELKMKGIDDASAKQALNDLEADWFELALELKQKKFGETVCRDYKEKAKQTRYLAYRGFGFDEIKYAIEYKDED